MRLGQIFRKMNDVFSRAACDFEDDTRHWQDISKDIENEIAIAYGCGRMLTVIDHLPRTFDSALASLPPRAFVQEFPLIRSRRLTARPHCRIIVATTRPLGT